MSQDSSALESTSRTDVRWWPLLLGGAIALALCVEVYAAGLRIRNYLRDWRDSGAWPRAAACSALLHE